MARKLRSNLLDTRTARLKLPRQKKPYWETIAPGISLGYRRSVKAGSWSVRAADGKGGNWVRGIDAIADDYENANETTVLTFEQAANKAKSIARGGTGHSELPVTVDQALTAYASDLVVRKQNEGNATHPRHHLTAGLLARDVSLLTVKELRIWRDALHAAGVKAATIDRINKSLKAALNLAARLDDRIKNDKAWRVGLAVIDTDDDDDEDSEGDEIDVGRNIVLTHEQRRDVVALSYQSKLLGKGCKVGGAAFGPFVEVHAATGARTSQIARLNVGDLRMTPPHLKVPNSKKGRNRKKTPRRSVPIAKSLALKLQALCAGRPANAPLLLRYGVRWGRAQHGKMFKNVAKAANLPKGATIYCLRHTSITRALLGGTNIRLVASTHDTSVGMIEQTYSQHITEHGDEQMRRTVFDSDAPIPPSNVIQMPENKRVARSED